MGFITTGEIYKLHKSEPLKYQDLQEYITEILGCI